MPPENGGTPQWVGAVEGLAHGCLVGWVLNIQQSDARVVVEARMGGEAIASAVADLARPDLARQFAGVVRHAPQDCCHGFVIDLAGAAPMAGTISVHVANLNAPVGVIEAAPADLETPWSGLCSDGGLLVRGWLVAPAERSVQALEAGGLLARAVAPDAAPGVPPLQTGSWTFQLELPLLLADGNVHLVDIVDAGGRPLNGSPVRVCCPASGLPALYESEANPASIRAVLAAFEERQPRGVGLSQFAAWIELFDVPPTVDKVPAMIGLIVSGSGDRAGTIERLRRQRDALVCTYDVPDGVPFGFVAQAALRDGCTAIAAVRAGDTLHDYAVAYMAKALEDDGAELAYCDTQWEGRPWFKPAWNATYALASDYPLHLLLVHANVAASLHAAATAADFGWQALAAVWHRAATAVRHVPRVLYTFGRRVELEEASAYAACARAALAHLPGASLDPLPGIPLGPGFLARRVKPRVPTRTASVSLLLPVLDRGQVLHRCVDSLLQYVNDPDVELVLVDGGSQEPEVGALLRHLEKQGALVLREPGTRNWPALHNRAAAAAHGELLCFLLPDVEALHHGWIEEMAGQLLRPGVGIVGAKLVTPEREVAHGGYRLGGPGGVSDLGRGCADSDDGDHARNQVAHEVSAVSSACMLMRKADFLETGGFDQRQLSSGFADVDLCLRIRQTGRAVVWTPYARLMRHTSAGGTCVPARQARMPTRAEAALRQRWDHVLGRDPAYHPALSLDAVSDAFAALALPPRDRQARDGHLPD